MATLSVADIGNYLKKDIEPVVQVAIYDKKEFYNIFKKNAGVQLLANNTYYITVETAGYQTTYSTPGSSFYSSKLASIQPSVSVKWGWTPFDVDDPALSAARSNQGSLVNLLMRIKTRAIEGTTRTIQRCLHGDGTGTLATANGSASASTTLTLNNSTPNGDIPGTFHLQPNFNVKIGSAAAVAITSVDSKTQVTLAANRAWSNGDTVKLADGDGTAADEPMGVYGAIDNGTVVATFQGITRSANPLWQSYRLSGGSMAANGENALYDAWIEAIKYGKNTKLILMNKTPYKGYGKLLTPDMRFKPSEKLMMGWAGLDFMGGAGEVHFDADTKDGHIFIVDPSSMTMGELDKVQFIDDTGDGRGILRRVDKASWQGAVKAYNNLIVKNCLPNAVIYAVTA